MPNVASASLDDYMRDDPAASRRSALLQNMYHDADDHRLYFNQHRDTSPDNPLFNNHAPESAPITQIRDLFFKPNPNTVPKPKPVTLDDTYPAILLTAWRVTRQLCLIRNQLTPEQSLTIALPPAKPHLWRLPSEDMNDAYTLTYADRPNEHTPAHLLNPLRAAMKLLPEFHAWYAQLSPDAHFLPQETLQPDPAQPNNYELITKPGTPLLPPLVPLCHHLRPQDIPQHGNAGGVADNYDPENPAHDPLLTLWLRTCRAIAAHHGMDASPEGAGALKNLYSPFRARLLHPSPVELCLFESEMILSAVRISGRTSRFGAREQMRSKYRLSITEAGHLMALSDEAVAHLHRMERNISQARAIAACEELMSSAQGAANPELALRTHKQIGLLLGLTRQSSEDSDPFAECRDYVQQLTEAGGSPKAPEKGEEHVEE